MRLTERWRATASSFLIIVASSDNSGRVRSVRKWNARPGLPQVRRQTLVPRAAAARADVHAIALQAARERAVALVDCGAHAFALEALRQRQAADAAANDENM